MRQRGKTYFISDCHLGAGYITDHRAHEARVVRFLDSIAADAAELFLLGDILDYWYEYRTVVPRGHVRFLGKLAELADAGVRVHWMTGNHDVWLFDYLRDELGIEVLRQATTVDVDGVKVFVSHGDDVGHQRPMYRFMKWCFTSRLCQCLYAAVHPRWTCRVATGWSRVNRTSRDSAGVEREKEHSAGMIERFVAAHHRDNPDVAHYVFGHLHLARQTRAGGADVVFLGDWIEQDTFAVLDGGLMSLRKFTPTS